jgi:hypothetical protein
MDLLSIVLALTLLVGKDSSIYWLHPKSFYLSTQLIQTEMRWINYMHCTLVEGMCVCYSEWQNMKQQTYRYIDSIVITLETYIAHNWVGLYNLYFYFFMINYISNEKLKRVRWDETYNMFVRIPKTQCCQNNRKLYNEC